MTENSGVARYIDRDGDEAIASSYETAQVHRSHASGGGICVLEGGACVPLSPNPVDA